MHLLSPTTGRRGWLRVLRQTTAGHPVLGAELLRRIRQRWSDDERRRVVNVFLPGAFQFDLHHRFRSHLEIIIDLSSNRNEH